METMVSLKPCKPLSRTTSNTSQCSTRSFTHEDRTIDMYDGEEGEEGDEKSFFFDDGDMVDSSMNLMLCHKDAETIDVSFDFVDLNEDDYHGVKNLITRSAVLPLLLDHDAIGCLTDTIVKQVEVGTAVKADDGLFGCATLMCLVQEKEEAAAAATEKKKKRTRRFSDVAKRLRKLLLKKCPKEHVKRLTDVLNENAALLINERVLNFPLQLVPALHDNLCRDLAWVCGQEKESGAEKTPFSDVRHVVVLSPSTKSSDGSGTFFEKFEEEMFRDEATIQFSFALPRVESDSTKRTTTGKGTSSRICEVTILPRSKLVSCVKKVKSFLAN